MKTKKLFFPLFLVILSITILIPFNVNAVSYYNWLQNPSFNIYSNYVEDGGFESGVAESGVTYGNFTTSGEYTGEEGSYSGVYSLKCIYGGSSNHWNYTFSEDYNETLGADIISLTFYYDRWFGDGDNINFKIYYSDGTSDIDDVIYVGNWDMYDATPLIDDSKYVIGFGAWAGGLTAYVQYDEVVMLVDDGEGQDTINLGTFPWHIQSSHDSYDLLDTTFGRLDSYSADFDTSWSYILAQVIDFLDTDWIHYIDFYAYGLDVDEGIKCIIIYSDGSSDYKSVLGSDAGSWVHFNLGKSWIDSGKYIRTIIFTAKTQGDTFVLDDVGLWSAYSYGIERFDFSLSPYPISITKAHFEVYKETSYTMNCFLTNLTSGTFNENGTWQYSDTFGIKNGTMENGYFSISLDRRSGNARTTENVSILILTGEETLYFEITSYWNPIVSDTDTGIGVTDVTGDFMTNWFIIAVFLLVIPIGIVGTVTGIMSEASGHVNPTMLLTTFLASETLMGAVSLSIGIINIWFMFVIIVVDVLIILGLIRSNN